MAPRRKTVQERWFDITKYQQFPVLYFTTQHKPPKQVNLNEENHHHRYCGGIRMFNFCMF
ncbi:hypothetical protein F652_1458 [Enterobacteriaceae bacterium bta3-1]|nr:hypothetical protein F652_1458 [Enterobacteriaceae bacterium bta3-1]